MARSSRRFKDAQAKRERGGFVALPYAVIRSQAFAGLGAHAVKLLCDLLSQYRGDNNGDLCAVWGVMHARGWRSRDTLERARCELLDGGWILISRQGGRHQATLYAVTFYAVDYCDGKLDMRPTGAPLSDWRKNEPLPATSSGKSCIPPAVSIDAELSRPSCQ